MLSTSAGIMISAEVEWWLPKTGQTMDFTPDYSLNGERSYKLALKNMAPIYSRPCSLNSSTQMKWYCHPNCWKNKIT